MTARDTAADVGEKNIAHLSEQERDKLPDSDFAFPKERKEPIPDAEHVRSAIARFHQVDGVGNGERDEAWERIRRAAKKFDVDVEDDDWRDMFRRNDREILKD